MNAIVPLNITALRVSPTDNTNVVPSFKGRVAYFDNMPYGSPSSRTSTGDTVVRLLESPDNALAPLNTGIHLHWELPDYFRKGVQAFGSSEVVFPQVPNRWLVTRYLNMYDPNTDTWSDATAFSWVVESDYISTSQLRDSDGVIRPSVPVPLPTQTTFGQQPFRFMGRVVPASEWPATAPGDQYLPDFNNEDDKPYYLTSIGFLGPGFAAYYPDCCSVFGFCDRFLDNSTIANALKNSTPIQFKASYQVIGWIDGADPLDDVTAAVTAKYNDYVAQCQEQQTAVTQTPADFFEAYALQQFKWIFDKDEITYTLGNNYELETLNVPQKTICNGIMQEVVWDMLESPGTESFLSNPDTPTTPAIWTDDEVTIAVGNTSIEALSALLKYDNDNTDNDPNLLENYEYLLDALQLSMLNNLENEGNKVIGLEEALHSAGFAREQGGLLWIVQQKPKDPADKQPVNASTEINLPLSLAEELSLLNSAQKAYDTGRSALGLVRKQLYMDWYRYIKMYAGGQTSPNVDTNTLANFLSAGGSGAIDLTIAQGRSTGILNYITATDGSGAIYGVAQPSPDNDTSLAYAVWQKYDEFAQAMTLYPDWQMLAVPAPPFWKPTDPVAMIEGNRIECVRRNGLAEEIPVRLSPGLLNLLDITSGDQSFGVATSDIPTIPVVNNQVPNLQDCQALIAEAFLLVPSLATAVATALQDKGGTGNPAVSGYTTFVTTLTQLQGGLSGLESSQTTGGLFDMIRTTNYVPAPNAQQSTSTPISLGITFTNANDRGWVMDAVAWSTQQHYPEFDADRYDPFLPVHMMWDVTFDPLTRDQDPRNYSSTNLTDYFSLDEEAVDNQYNPQHNFTTQEPVAYDGSVVLSKKATFSLIYQIESYERNYPDDPANPELSAIAENYRGRNILSQTMSGLNNGQLLRYYIPQITVEDLTISPGRDTITPAVNNAALYGNPGDNWYDGGFNADAPVPTGPMALGNFGPLRSGFLAVNGLEIVDVFGQRMTLSTPKLNSDGSMDVIAAMTMAPAQGDTANEGKMYLPPRLLAPSRMWFRWLSASYNNDVPGISDDFVEMNTHPATSPVCGWVMPNHLDNDLFFYDANGAAIGSFGIEHNSLKYRTRAGNPNNPSDSLAVDIGPEGSPTVNAHLADFMWYVNNRSGSGTDNSGFLADLMRAILGSDKYISPENFAQDGSLAVLVGRPLAIVRSVLGMESAGGLLPLNQADVTATDPWPTAINAQTRVYTDRMQNGSANLANIQIPVRLGDLSNMDDGLIGYLIEQEGNDPYGNGNFYAPAAPANGSNGVVAPAADTLELNLNAAVKMLTLLIDPRAGVHATTGVLPVEELAVPPDQYKAAMNALQMTFVTLPILQQRQQLTVPLPDQNGYVWSWVMPGNQQELPLAPNAGNSNTAWGYTPQTLLEGWLELSPDPNTAPLPPETP